VLRARSARKKAYAHVFSGSAPYYVVNEYPKSGGSWVSELMASTLDIPYRRRNEIRLERSVVHGHFLYRGGLRNVLTVWRDPRDLLVSFYYHSLFINEFGNDLLVEMTKEQLPFVDYGDIRANLPEFIRFVSTTPISPHFTWPRFAKAWLDLPGVLHTSYEAMRADTPAELARILEELTGTRPPAEAVAAAIEKHSFKKAKAEAEQNRPAGTEVSFFREGSLGGWRKSFTPEAEAQLERFGYIEPMRRLGYEP